MTLLETETAFDASTVRSAPGDCGCRVGSFRGLVVMPTYNEADNIVGMLTSIIAAVPTVEIAVVDDGSPDGTADLARAVGREHPGRVHVIGRDAKDGLGSAYRHGFAWALSRCYDVIVQMDADGSHPVDRLPQMVDLIRRGRADVVVGSRYVRGGETVGWPVPRRVLSVAGNVYARLVLGLRTRDTTGGFKAWSRDGLAAIHPELTTLQGYGFQMEMAAAAERSGLDVTEIPISFRDRCAGESKMTTAIAVEAVRSLWSLRRRLLRPFGRLEKKDSAPVWA